MVDMKSLVFGLMGGILGTIFGFLGWIISTLIIGALITPANTAFSAICNSGWLLALLFNPSGGIVTVFPVVGIFIMIAIGSIGGAIGGYAIGGGFSHKR
jgi:hypothetical protein